MEVPFMSQIKVTIYHKGEVVVKEVKWHESGEKQNDPPPYHDCNTHFKLQQVEVTEKQTLYSVEKLFCPHHLEGYENPKML